MRSYAQYCGLAKALDVVGDRWVLLIVRELLIRGYCRYSDLKEGLPGIATNLLAQRLRDLERAGLIMKETAPPPIAVPVYRLTARGKELEPVIAALGQWASPLMTAPAKRDSFRAHWLALPAELYLADRDPDGPPVTIELRVDNEAVTLATSDGGVRATLGRGDRPDAVLRGPPQLMLGVLTGRLGLATARAQGLYCEGSAAAVRRFRRKSEPTGRAATPRGIDA